jgi:hypothetical protein
MHDKWWGWAVALIIFAVVQAWRALFRSTKATSGKADMARMNAAAQRILKERGASVANPIPRSNSMGTQSKGTAATRAKTATAKPRSAPLPKSTTPAVIRRNGILSGAREPVIQRRR